VTEENKWISCKSQARETIIINVTNKTISKRRQGHKTLKAKNSLSQK